MHDSRGGQKNEVCVMDAWDLATKLRAAIGYLADTAQNEQLAAVLWTVEDTAGILENLLQMLAQGEKESNQKVAEDVPFE